GGRVAPRVELRISLVCESAGGYIPRPSRKPARRTRDAVSAGPGPATDLDAGLWLRRTGGDGGELSPLRCPPAPTDAPGLLGSSRRIWRDASRDRGDLFCRGLEPCSVPPHRWCRRHLWCAARHLSDLLHLRGRALPRAGDPAPDPQQRPLSFCATWF